MYGNKCKINEDVLGQTLMFVSFILSPALSILSKYQTSSSIIEQVSSIRNKLPLLAVLSKAHRALQHPPLSCAFLVNVIDTGVQVGSANQSPVWHLVCLVCPQASCPFLVLWWLSRQVMEQRLHYREAILCYNHKLLMYFTGIVI